MSYELETKLPSKGLLYDNIKPDVVIRNMKTAEQKKLLGSMSSANTLDRIVEACVVSPKGLKMNDLVPADSDFLLTKLRIHSYGSQYDVMVPTCQCCGNKRHKVTLDLNDLVVDELSDDYTDHLVMELPESGDKLELRLITNREIESCEDRAKKLARRNPSVDIEEASYIFRLCKSIVTVNGETYDPPRLQSYVEDMHVRDNSYIWHCLGKIKFGYNKLIEYECEECGEVIEFKLPMTGDFFRSKFTD